MPRKNPKDRNHDRERPRSQRIGSIATRMRMPDEGKTRTRNNGASIVPTEPAPDGTTPVEAAADIIAMKNGISLRTSHSAAGGIVESSMRNGKNGHGSRSSIAMIDIEPDSVPGPIRIVARYMLRIASIIMHDFIARNVKVSKLPEGMGFTLQYDRIDKQTSKRWRVTVRMLESAEEIRP